MLYRFKPVLKVGGLLKMFVHEVHSFTDVFHGVFGINPSPRIQSGLEFVSEMSGPIKL